MIKQTRIFILLALFSAQMLSSFADRGIGKKKNRVVLNIKTPVNSTFNAALNYNLRTGLRYTGSLMNTALATPSVQNNFNTVVTYSKGNSIYILPYKQKVVLVADMRQGYTGTKLIIRPR